MINEEITNKILLLEQEFISKITIQDTFSVSFDKKHISELYDLSSVDDLIDLNKYQVIKLDWFFFKKYNYQIKIKECEYLLVYNSNEKIRRFALNTLNEFFFNRIQNILLDKIILDRQNYKDKDIGLMIGNQTDIYNFLCNIGEKYKCEDYNLHCSIKKYFLQLNNALNKFFTIKSIVQGMINFFEKFFQLEIIQINELHQDYKLFYINENITKWKIQIWNIYENGIKIGTFYLDLYARDNKLPYSCITPLISNEISPSYPIINICINIPNESSMICLDDLTDLFHEFGHMFHLIFVGKESFMEYPSDFIEIPSTLFENFIRSPNILKLLSHNHEQIDNNFITLINECLEIKYFYNKRLQYKKALIDFQLYTEPISKLKDIIKENSYLLSNIQSFNYKMDAYKYLYSSEKSTELYNKIFINNELNYLYGKKFRNEFLSLKNSHPLKIFSDYVNSYTFNKA